MPTIPAFRRLKAGGSQVQSHSISKTMAEDIAQ
jgi:hypothetical protein